MPDFGAMTAPTVLTMLITLPAICSVGDSRTRVICSPPSIQPMPSASKSGVTPR